jgi:hypothetical protein
MSLCSKWLTVVSCLHAYYISNPYNHLIWALHEHKSQKTCFEQNILISGFPIPTNIIKCENYCPLEFDPHVVVHSYKHFGGTCCYIPAHHSLPIGRFPCSLHYICTLVFLQGLLLYSEDEGSRVLQNSNNFSSDCTSRLKTVIFILTATGTSNLTIQSITLCSSQQCLKEVVGENGRGWIMKLVCCYEPKMMKQKCWEKMEEAE